MIKFMLCLCFCYIECGLRKIKSKGIVKLNRENAEEIDQTFISLSGGLGIKEHKMLWIFQNQATLFIF